MAEQEKELAIQQDDSVYNRPTQAVPKPEANIGIDTKNTLITNIVQSAENGYTAQSGQLDLSAINSFTSVSQKRDELYKLLDSMTQDSIIAAVLETYAEDATEYNDAGQIVWAESSDANVSKFVNFLLDSMRVDKNIYSWVYSLCKYGDLYIQLYKQSEYDKIDELFDTEEEKEQKRKALNEDIKINAYQKSDKYVHYVEAVTNPAEMFELTKFGKSVGYIKADLKIDLQREDNLTNNYFRYKFRKSDINIYPATKFVHASLEDNSSRTEEEVSIFIEKNQDGSGVESNYTVKRGQSLLYNTFKIWRELSLLENSMLLNRITKSSIVRMINVEVGDMPKEMVGPHLQGIKSLMEQKAAINTGKSMNEYTNPGPIENNIYVPTHQGVGAITSEQIGGDVNVGQLPDIDYFQNKMFGSLRVPKQYFGVTDDGAGFNGGASLSIISSRYAKMVKRIQNAIIQAITDIINLMLIDKGMNYAINKFTIRMQSPTTQEEIDRRDNTSSKIAITSDIMNLVGEIEDPIKKLKILKSLLSNVITDSEVIEYIQEEIDNLEENPDAIPMGDSEPGDNTSRDSSPISSGESEPLDLDAELDLGTDFEETDETSSENNLPSPDDLGLDLTDNNAVEEQ